jgi:uncharacterized BrkB/YihY/UPF0761 family membrane protein
MKRRRQKALILIFAIGFICLGSLFITTVAAIVDQKHEAYFFPIPATTTHAIVWGIACLVSFLLFAVFFILYFTRWENRYTNGYK